MAERNKDATGTADREIITSRVFDAPRELVWEAWTHEIHVAQWWGPNGFTNTFKEFDVKPGGHFDRLAEPVCQRRQGRRLGRTRRGCLEKRAP